MSWQIKVTVLRADRPQLTASFTSSPITIGTRPQNDVVLDDPFISGEHALVYVSRSELVVRDKSTNGTFYEGRRLQEINLGREGRISIPPFDVELVLEIDDHAWKTAMRKDLLKHLPPEPPGVGGQLEGESVGDSTLRPIPAPATPSAADARRDAGGGSASVLREPLARAGHDHFFLQVVQGPEHLRQRSFTLPEQPAIVGRSETAEIHLETATISREHARLSPLGSDRFLLTDLGSSNGCFVGDLRVQTTELGEGAEFRLADVVFRLRRTPASHDEARITSPRPAEPPLSIRSPSPPHADALVVEVDRAQHDPAVVFLTVRGRIDGLNYTQLADKLDTAIGEGARLLSIDLGAVDYVSAAGLGAIVKCASRLRQLRGDLFLVRPNQPLCDAILLSNLDHLFRDRLVSNHEAAVASWKSKPR